MKFLLRVTNNTSFSISGFGKEIENIFKNSRKTEELRIEWKNSNSFSNLDFNVEEDYQTKRLYLSSAYYYGYNEISNFENILSAITRSSLKDSLEKIYISVKQNYMINNYKQYAKEVLSKYKLNIEFS